MAPFPKSTWNQFLIKLRKYFHRGSLRILLTQYWNFVHVLVKRCWESFFLAILGMQIKIHNRFAYCIPTFRVADFLLSKAFILLQKQYRFVGYFSYFRLTKILNSSQLFSKQVLNRNMTAISELCCSWFLSSNFRLKLLFWINEMQNNSSHIFHFLQQTKEIFCDILSMDISRGLSGENFKILLQIFSGVRKLSFFSLILWFKQNKKFKSYQTSILKTSCENWLVKISDQRVWDTIVHS